MIIDFKKCSMGITCRHHEIKEIDKMMANSMTSILLIRASENTHAVCQ